MDALFNHLKKSIKYFLITVFINLTLFQAVLAQTIKSVPGHRCCFCCPQPHPWFVTGEFGYGNYFDMYLKDGQIAVGRFSIGRDLAEISFLNLSLEAGIQNGNISRFPLDKEEVTDFPTFTHVSVNPMMDLLLTAKFTPSHAVPLFALIKLGPAYRRLHFLDRESVNDKTKLSIEAQAGLGYQINNRTHIHLSYQRIFGSNPNFHVVQDSEENQQGYINKLPSQYAVLFGISTSL